MECFLQYLDDLDDIVYAVALIGEKLRRLARQLLALTVLAVLLGLGILLAIKHPPIAVAAGSILLVAALYQGAVRPGREYSTSA